MGINLTDLYIDETFPKLVQTSGSVFTDGTGSLLTEVDITASNSISSSHSVSASHLTGNADNVETIDFIDGGISAEQRLSWNDADGTLDLGLKGGNVTLQIGQEQVTRVVNGTGTNLSEAQYRVVKIIGAQGQRLQVDLAQANSDINSATTLGLVTENIDNNQEGFITTQGSVRGINTTGTLQGETWNDGDVLYLSPTTPGVITNVKPISPAHLVVVGFVEYAHQNNGKVYVKVDNGYELEELHDVLITNPVNGEALVYENGLWINSDVPHISASYAVSSSQAENANTATSASYALTASYALNAGGGEGFPYTGSADISGSLNVVGPITSETFGTISLTGDSPGINRNILDFSGADFSVIKSDAGLVIDNTAGSGSVSVFTNGNMQFEPQGDLDFYTPTGRINLTAADANLTVNGGPLNFNLTNGDNTSVVQVNKGISNYLFGINQFPGFTGSILSANNVDEFKVTGDIPLSVDNTGFGGNNDVSLKASEHVRLEAQNDIYLDATDQVQITSNTTDPFQGIGLNAPNVRINLTSTGSTSGDFAVSAPGFGNDTPGLLMSLGTGSYGDNPTTAQVNFTGDDAFFSALGNFYIKNIFNDTGSITVWSENQLQLRGDTQVTISGDTFSNPNDPIDINIQGSTFMDSFTSGIMAFQPQIGTYTRVSQYQRAFVETPLVINGGGTVEVQTGATLKVINEL